MRHSRSGEWTTTLVAMGCLGILGLLPACADKGVGAGNPRTLAPLIGGGGRVLRKAKPPAEPVDDYVVDVGALRRAWPQVDHQLPRLLRSVIARGSWRDMHHAVACAGGVLRVRHRPEVVAEAKKLVALLRHRLLSPMHLQVRFVEVDAKAVATVFPRSADGERSFAPEAFTKALASKSGRGLARAVFHGENGRWGKRSRLFHRSFVAGVTHHGGVIRPRLTTLASGSTLQAAAWRFGAERAVVALTGSYTGEARGGITLKQQLNQRLPSAKTTERRWQSHELALPLPVRELVEIQSTLAVRRGSWTLAALVPRRDGRRVAALVKVDWSNPTPKQGGVLASDVKVAPLAPTSDFSLSVIPVALPRMNRRPVLAFNDDEISNRRVLKDQAAGWFRKRAEVSQIKQKRRVYNFQNAAGQLAFGTVNRAALRRVHTFSPAKTEGFRFSKTSRGSSLRPPGGGFGAMPPALEALKAEVLTAKWPPGTALEFVANHVFVVHKKDVAAKVAKLLAEVHRWRNQRMVAQLSFPKLSDAHVDGLSSARVSSAQLATLRKGKRLLEPLYLLGRGSSRSEVFVGEMHAVLSRAWAPDSSSPPVHVFWRGLRAAMLPRLGASGGRSLGLHLRHYRLAQLKPRRVAGALLQQPRDATWAHRQQVSLAQEGALLTSVGNTPEGLTGLVVEARWKQ